MKIALIKHKTGYANGVDREAYKQKINYIIDTTDADIIVGPEVAISNGCPLTDFELKNFYRDLIRDDKLIVPGTCLIGDRSSGILRNTTIILSPTFSEGFLSFDKMCPTEEEKEIAKNKGFEFTYRIDDHNRNKIFTYKSKKIAIETYNDHKKMKLLESRNFKRQADIEFILSSGTKLENLCPQNAVVDKGLFCVVDGYTGDTYAHCIENGKLKEIITLEKDDYALVKT